MQTMFFPAESMFYDTRRFLQSGYQFVLLLAVPRPRLLVWFGFYS